MEFSVDFHMKLCHAMSFINSLTCFLRDCYERYCFVPVGELFAADLRIGTDDTTWELLLFLLHLWRRLISIVANA